MLSRKEFIQQYWKNYILLENRFLHTMQYVELDAGNFNTFSIEFMSQLISIGAELDTLFKELAGVTSKNRATIKDYASEILKKKPEITDQKITVKRTNLDIQPFCNWDISNSAKSLLWWNEYNEVKHNRVVNFKKANQITVLNMLGALYIMENYLLKDIAKQGNGCDIADSNSSLFEMINWSSYYTFWGNTVVMQKDGILNIDPPEAKL